jgi:hypothetical protein
MSAVIERASRADRVWFKRHRDRAYRLRPALNGEFPGATFPAGAVQLALVKQVRPGSRLRLALWATRPLCDCQDCLGQIWDRAAPAEVRALTVEIGAIALLTEGVR